MATGSGNTLRIDLDAADVRGHGRRAACGWAVFVVGAIAALSPRVAHAGPPFVTDDPEPVEYRHWEWYLASQHAHDRDGWTGTAPHVEVNYGAVPDLQLHLVAPLAYAAPSGGTSTYGYGDTELGAKFRFLHEGAWMPQVGAFPLVEVPTGSHARGLGNGKAQVYLPVWLQKSFGPWTTYGGAGYWINPGEPGEHHRNWWYLGWLVQRQLTGFLAAGVELFHSTPKSDGDPHETGFNAGVMLDLTSHHHVLLSAGRAIHGPTMFSGYAAYQLTFGPAP